MKNYYKINFKGKIKMESGIQYKFKSGKKLNLLIKLLILHLTLNSLYGNHCYSQWIQQYSLGAGGAQSCFFINPNTGFVVNYQNIKKTTNGGNNWTTSFSTGFTMSSVFFADSNYGWAVGNVGMFRRTTDGGTTWFGQSGMLTSFKSIYFVNQLTGIAVGSSGEIARTNNGGDSWSYVYSNPSLGDLKSVYFSDPLNGWVVGGGVILNTTNGGINWNINASGAYLSSVHFENINTGWVVGTAGSIMKTTNGGINWFDQISNITGISLLSVFFININTGWVSGDSGKILKTINGGNNWIRQPTGVTSNLYSIHCLDTNIGYAVGGTWNYTNGIVMKTTNGGNSHDVAAGPFLGLPFYIQVNSSVPVKSKVSNVGNYNEASVPVKFFINESLINTINKNLNIGQVDSVINNWNPTDTGIYNLMYVVTAPIDINRLNDTVRATVKVVQNILFPAVPEEFISSLFPPTGWSLEYTGTLYWSRADVSAFGLGTGSAKFQFYIAPSGNTQSLVTQTFYIPTIAGDSLRFDEAYATYQSEIDSLRIEYSTNSGSVWNTVVSLSGGVNGPLVTAPPTQLEFTPTPAQWKRQTIGLPVGTNKLRFRTVSAYGNNLFIDSISVGHNIISGLIGNNNNIPKKYSLSQNYPNPFNPVTKINFDIPKQGFVTLKIYDLLGKEVRTLVSEVKSPGYYSVDFNGSDLSSGVYFYKLVAGEFTENKRMALVK